MIVSKVTFVYLFVIDKWDAVVSKSYKTLQSEKTQPTQQEVGFNLHAQTMDVAFQRIYDSKMICIHFAETDEHCTITEANEAFLQLLGYNLDELKNGKLSWKNITPQEYWVADERAVEHFRQNGYFEPYDKQFFHKQGHRVDVLFGGASLESYQSGMLCFTVDMTQRRHAEKEAYSKACQQEIVADLGHKALKGLPINKLMDETAHLVSRALNVKYAKILEYLQDENLFRVHSVCGFSSDLLGKVVGRNEESHASYIVATQRPVIVEDVWHHSPFPPSYVHKRFNLISGIAVVIPGKDGVIGVLQADSDVKRSFNENDIHFMQLVATILSTAFERKQFEEELAVAKNLAESANLKKSQFMSNMSHELRTPLNAIIGYSRMLESGLGGRELSDKEKKYLHYISISGQHLLEMVNDILDLAKIEAGKVVLEKQTFHLRPFLIELLELLAVHAHQQDINLSYEIQDGIDLVLADPVRLRQIYFNLVSNAIKFNRQGGQVVIKVWLSSDREWVVSNIHDTGIGIPEDKIIELFTDFYQVDNTFARKKEGTGLGLALTRRLVELHHGSIDVESEEGKGSTFCFRIPAK